MSYPTKPELLARLKSIFRGSKFSLYRLAEARVEILHSYNKMKNGTSMSDEIRTVHADLVTFDILLDMQKHKRAKNGQRILPYPEIVKFSKNHANLKRLLTDIESNLEALA